jgi:hypothetical protein
MLSKDRPRDISIFRAPAIVKSPVVTPQAEIAITALVGGRDGKIKRSAPEMTLISPANTKHSERSVGGV